MIWPSLLNPATAISIIGVWMICVAIMMGASGLAAGDFFSFGPNAKVTLFGNPIDTYSRYFLVMAYLVVNQTVQTYGLETISPWMITIVQNRAHIEPIENPKKTQLIISVWYIYLWSGRIFGIQVMLSQIDFLLVVLVVDLVATFSITRKYIEEKNKPKIDESDSRISLISVSNV